MADNKKTERKISKLTKLISKVKIGVRVQVMALVLICAIAIPMVISIKSSSNYISTYNEVLENLDSIRYIMDETQAQGNRILGYCVVSKNIDQSGETEIIVTMQNKIKAVRENIESDTDKGDKRVEQLEVVENLLNNYIESYKEGLALCDDTFSLAGDTKFYSMVNTAEYLSNNCNKLLSLELERCGQLNAQILKNFRQSIYNIIVVVIIIIIISVLLSMAISLPI